jgi:hypothetical protein
MAGEAITNNFVLNTATVMIGAQTDFFNLNPAAHSIGLVKNFKITATPQYTTLTQGVKNTIVDSQLTNNEIKATMEVYEYSAKNLKYALGLDGTTLTTTGATSALKTSITAAATAALIVGDVSTTFGVGDWIEIQENDNVHLAKLSAVAYSSPDTTLTFTGYAIPTGVTFTSAAKIRKVAVIPVGSKTNQPYLSAKVVSGDLQDNAPIVLAIPKLRITRGFDIDFKTDAYSNMPFEFTPYDLTSSDTTVWNKFPTNDSVQVLRPVA